MSSNARFSRFSEEWGEMKMRINKIVTKEIKNKIILILQ